MASTDVFPIDPDYPLEVARTDPVLRQPAESGKIYERQKRPHQRLFRLQFLMRSTDDLETVRAFYAQFRGQDEYFVFNHKVWANNAGAYAARKFPVQFASPLRDVLVLNEATGIEVELLEAVGRALETADYPGFSSGFETFFIEESHAIRAAALVGTWTTETNSNNHGPATNNGKTNPNTNTTDKFRYTYFGYGFRYWARKASNLGILQVLLDGVSLGNVDLYNASGLAAAALLTKADVKLGLHTVDLVATNTKNASSSANTIIADALEVLP